MPKKDATDTLLTAIISTLPARVFWKDRGSRYLGCNPAFARDAGLHSPAELIGRTDDELGWAEYADRYRADDAQVMSSGQARVDYEEPQTTPDGRRIWLRTSKVPLRDALGEVVGVLGMYQDITDEREARARLERSEAALARARDGVFWAGPEGVLEATNQALCSLIGATPDGLVGRHVQTVLPAMDADTWRDLWHQLEAHGDLVVEGTAGAGLTPVEITLGMVVVGAHRSAMGLVRDLRTRQAMQAQLHASEARFHALIDQSPTPTRLFSLDGRCLAENLAWRQWWGGTEADAADYRLWQDPQLAAMGLISALRRVVAGETLDVGPLAQARSGPPAPADDLPPTWVRIHAWPVRDELGQTQAIAFLQEDLTRRYEMERDLRETRALHEEAQRIAKLGHWRLEHATQRLSWSQQTYRIFVQDPLDFTPSVEAFLGCVHPEDRDRVAEAWQASLRDGVPYDVQHRVLTPTGQERWVHERCETHRDTRGRPVESVGTSADITARRLAEQEQEALRRRLEATERLESVGRLAGGIAHDFNNMLGVILGRATLALESLPAPHPAREDLHEVLDAAQRSAELTRRLLVFARRQPAVPVQVELNAHIQGLMMMLERLMGEAVTLRWSPSPRGCPVRIDPAQLDQVITNLCVNARDAITGIGSVHISTECSHRSDPDGESRPVVTLSVRDTGCGISPEVQERLFEPFFSTKPPGLGTGLGLPTVYGIVQQAGGQIEVHTGLGVGSTFRVHLPADTEETLAQAPGAREPVRDSAPTDRVTVLVVEDEDAVMRLTCRMLQNLGYRVLSASSPRRALELVRQERPHLDLMLTDTIMPEMTGRELAQAIHAEAPEISVVFMSGYTADVLAPQGVLEEDIDFLQKPFSGAELHARLQAVLRRDRRPI